MDIIIWRDQQQRWTVYRYTQHQVSVSLVLALQWNREREPGNMEKSKQKRSIKQKEKRTKLRKLRINRKSHKIPHGVITMMMVMGYDIADIICSFFLTTKLYLKNYCKKTGLDITLICCGTRKFLWILRLPATWND